MEKEPAACYLAFLEWLDNGQNVAAMGRQWGADGRWAPESTLFSWKKRWLWESRLNMAIETKLATDRAREEATNETVRGFDRLSEEAQERLDAARARAKVLEQISDKALRVASDLLDDHLNGRSQVNPTNVSAMLQQALRALDAAIDQVGMTEGLKDALSLVEELTAEELARARGEVERPKDGRGRWSNTNAS